MIHSEALFDQDNNMEILEKEKIYKLGGYRSFIIKFDVKEGFIISIEETFDYFYFLLDNSVIEITGVSKSNFVKL